MTAVIDHDLKRADCRLYPDALEKQSTVGFPLSEPRKAASSIAALLSREKVRAACVRIRFGGDVFDGPVRLDKDFLDRFVALTPFFPFYVPATHNFLSDLLSTVDACPVYTWFETALFKRLPETERVYALPYDQQEKMPIRRFGSHGILHEFHAGLSPAKSTVLSVIFDKQTTVCGLSKGLPRYISSGYTPLEGVMGRSSCGDLDPGVVFHLMRENRESFYRLDSILKRESGFFGMTGVDREIDDLYGQRAESLAIQAAFSLYEAQIMRHIGHAMAVSGAPNTLVMGGRYLRALMPLAYRLARHLSFLGLALKPLPWPLEGSNPFRADTGGSSIHLLISPTEVMDALHGLFTDWLSKTNGLNTERTAKHG